MEPIIEIENLSKKYRIGASKRYLSLREELGEKVRRMCSRFSPSTSRHASSAADFWALKNFSFSVQKGEAIGIIGRNGAGKSTLLKILSQITPPTEGKITLRGRVASLLEVGTGFHPELTGRENIYLNGAILGMHRAEIKSKFDEIVAFSEIEKFLDTPVKRYSSGMYVRLAFAVAAHLEPEILIVDEVLAVGDVQFQKKCLGKMGEVARKGRTVLFVSHNMQAIRMLCERAVLLQEGKLVDEGKCETIVSRYLCVADVVGAEKIWQSDELLGDEGLRLLVLKVVTPEGVASLEHFSNQDIFVEMLVQLQQLDDGLRIGFEIFWQDGTVILTSFHNDTEASTWPKLKLGLNRLRCRIPPGLLNGGRYSIAPRIGIHCVRWIVHEPPCVEFTVRILHGQSHFWLAAQSRPGLISPAFQWDGVSVDQLC